MKEILFRGKRVDNQEWVYGYYYNDGKRSYINIPFESMKEVNTETIGQFIGIKDIKGNKIFEGDIINIFWSIGQDTAEIITYCEKYGYYKYGNNPICELLEDDKIKYLIVGNINELKKDSV